MLWTIILKELCIQHLFQMLIYMWNSFCKKRICHKLVKLRISILLSSMGSGREGVTAGSGWRADAQGKAVSEEKPHQATRVFWSVLFLSSQHVKVGFHFKKFGLGFLSRTTNIWPVEACCLHSLLMGSWATQDCTRSQQWRSRGGETPQSLGCHGQAAGGEDRLGWGEPQRNEDSKLITPVPLSH